jgi:tetratricopeptide (TPR) repeat protein
MPSFKTPKLIKCLIAIVAFLLIRQTGSCISPDRDKNTSFTYPGYTSEHDTAIINNFVRKGNLFLKNAKNPWIVDSYIDSALKYCDRQKIEIPPTLHLLIAENSYNTIDFTKAEESAKKAAALSQSSHDIRTYIKSLQFLGSYYLRTGFFRESSDYFMRSIEIAKNEKVKGFIPLGYAGEASVLNAAGDIKGYRHNLELMIDAAFAENDLGRAESGLLALGNSYSSANEFDMADSVLRRCISVSLRTKDTYYTGFSTANIGWGFYNAKLYDSALYYYKKSLDYSVPNNFYGISANSLGNIGTIYRDLGKSAEAISFYKKSIEEAKKVNDWYSLSWVYNDMSMLFLTKKDTARAYTSYIKYKQYNDSLLSNKRTKGLEDARIRYEADMHNKEIALLSLRLKNNRILNFGFTGLIVLIAVIAVLLVRGARNEEKRRLSELNMKISELTQANLRQQMNPHFIFNTLNSIQYYMFQHDKLATNEYLTKFSSLMRKVLENSQNTAVFLRDELDALTLYLELESLRFKDKFQYEIKVDDEIDPLLYKVPTMLIQPYVENSICHGLKQSDGKGIVSIDIKLGKNQLICTIEDNGIGREAAKSKAEAAGGNHNSLGTRITGSRLDLVNSLYGTTLKTIYTDLFAADGTPGGTRVEIQIPIIT